ncbi:hypothetical protein JD969_01845 [Planctomycetota bacterium]|nr:hypothetical protein JD969_01845 [Planctomycetota bacterium]
MENFIVGILPLLIAITVIIWIFYKPKQYDPQIFTAQPMPENQIQKLQQLLDAIDTHIKKTNNHERLNDPIVDYHLFFDNNTFEGSIAPNQEPFGLPRLHEMYLTLQQIEQHPQVHSIWVSIHSDYDRDDLLQYNEWPSANCIFFLTTNNISEDQILDWTNSFIHNGLIADELLPTHAYLPRTNDQNLFGIWWD